MTASTIAVTTANRVARRVATCVTCATPMAKAPSARTTLAHTKRYAATVWTTTAMVSSMVAATTAANQERETTRPARLAARRSIFFITKSKAELWLGKSSAFSMELLQYLRQMKSKDYPKRSEEH